MSVTHRKSVTDYDVNYKGGQVNLGADVPANTVKEQKQIVIGSRIELVKLDLENYEERQDSSKIQTGWKQFIGLTFAVFASLFFSMVLVLVKVLKDYHPFSIAAFRQWGNVIPAILLVIYFRIYKKLNILEPIFPIKRMESFWNITKLSVLGILSASIVLFRFLALKYVSVADVNVITYSGPILTVISAHFVLKEKCGITPLVVGVWTLIGVVVIARPPFLTGEEMDINILIGTGVTLIAVLFLATSSIMLRKIRSIHFSLTILAFGILGLIESYVVALAFGVLKAPEGLADIGYIILLSLFSFLGEICTILAFKFEKAGTVSLIRTVDVIFAFVLQMIFLGVFPDVFSILGASIVMVGVLVTASRKLVSTLPEEDSKRKALSFLLR